MKIKRCSRCFKERPEIVYNRHGKAMKECEQCYNHMRDIWAFKRRDKSQDQLPIKIFTGIEAVDEAILNRNDSFSERYNRAMNLLKYVDVSD